MSQQVLTQVAVPDEEMGSKKKLPHHPQIPFTPAHLDECEDDYLLLPSEVADLFRVEPKTVTRWSGQAGITDVRTPGNHHRFKAGEIKKLYHGGARIMNEGDK